MPRSRPAQSNRKTLAKPPEPEPASSSEQPPSPTLDRLRGWFKSRGWTPWPFQESCWSAYSAGESGLLHVPTGAGKTYAAFFAPLADIVDDQDLGRGIRILYVTPLRAVSRDIEAAMRLPAESLDLNVRIESRTGDTTSSARARQKTRLPDVLITTPESLTLLLTYTDAPDRFRNLRAVIVDEWHELLGSKRGTQTELALARLRRWSPDLRTWALSATLSNLREAAEAATGSGRPARLIGADIPRPVEIHTLIPSSPDAFPWAGHLGLSMLPEVVDAIDPDLSTLIFTNTRSQAERWYQAILATRPDWEPHAALHHGSIDRDERERVEAGLKDGSVRLVVATSSLDLGVDFAPVERVFQVGSPKGIARLIQRAGRAAHRPGAPCSIVCVPTHGMELIEVAAVRRAISHTEIEPRTPEPKPLDVLAQHMVTCALGGGFDPDALFEEVRTTAAYASLTREEFDWTLALVREGGGTLRAYPEYCKIIEDNGVYTVPQRRIAQLHRLNVGTITGEATVDIRFQQGRRLGSIEEAFVSRLRPGEKFVFGGRILAFVRLYDMVCTVRAASGRTNHTPHWAGTKLPISETLSRAVRETLQSARDDTADSPELHAASGLIEAQSRLSRVPDAHEILIEACSTREGHHLSIYPFEGRLVHAGLAAIIALRLTRLRPATLTTAANDYGFELLSQTGTPLHDLLTPELFFPENLAADAIESVNLGELAKRQFREIARVAGLVFQSYPGSRKSARQVQANASLIYDVYQQFDPDNLLMHQARREVLEKQFQQTRLARTMQRLHEGPRVLVQVDKPTPLGLPLVIERIGATLSSETLLERIEHMKQQWAATASPSNKPASSSTSSPKERSGGRRAKRS